MRLLRTMCFVLLVPGLMLAQTGGSSNSSSSSDSTSFANELKALRDAMSAQQKQIAEQQQQIGQQQKEIQQLRQQVSGPQNVAANTADPAPRVVDASLHNANAKVTNPAAFPASDAPDDMPKDSPLSFRIGGAEFTPGGFVDFETVFRTTNLGSGISTSYGALPFNNVVQGHLTELRVTGQYSRYNLKVTDKFGDNNVTGYLEGDFNGNDAANVFVGTNPHTNRLRLYWVDLKRGKWEFLGGQSWGLLTPNRTGLSPNPSDLALTYGEDANVHVGVNHTRAGTFRAVYHPNDNWAIGASIENADQFVAAGEVIFPFSFNAALGVQFDANNQTTVPNAYPDFIPKIAYDNNFGNGQHVHFEVGGLLTTVKITNVPTGGPGFVHHQATGGSVEGAFNVDLVKGFRVIANGVWGAGNGRYLIGLGPQAVVRPIQTGVGTFDIEPSLVHSGNGTVGFEVQPSIAPKSQFGLYYGGAYFQRNSFIDVTSPLPIKPTIGFGGINSPNSANRAIQEVTLDWTQTLWKSPQHGALLFITQTSYVTRSPWFVAAGAPKNAHLALGYVSLRYVLP
ncbi:MAG TPA: hypothetical protein VNW97_19525 [Candidatus Saccharimonadales bacterium]|jgi:hypothetical protein|nr:hypothetical protein [Candidatus Saccharimonadales bacterium]